MIGMRVEDTSISLNSKDQSDDSEIKSLISNFQNELGQIKGEVTNLKNEIKQIKESEPF